MRESFYTKNYSSLKIRGPRMPEPEDVGSNQNEIPERITLVPVDIGTVLSSLSALDQEISKIAIADAKIKVRLEESARHLRKEFSKVEQQVKQNYSACIDLIETLKFFRLQIMHMREEIINLISPPLLYGYVIRFWPDEKLVDIYVNNERRKVNVFSKEVDIGKLQIGRRVLLAPNNLAILAVDEEWEKTGNEAKALALLSDDVVRVVTHFDEIRNVILAEPLKMEKIREGDIMLVSENFAFKKLPKTEVGELLLEKVPDINFSQIGGLKNQIDALLEAVEYPALYPELFSLHKLKPTKGILLYGPPGCGKTLIAKAVANRLSQRLREKINSADIHAYFINVKGPELLNKWVGETERKIREVFSRAKEKATEGAPVIIFFDEFESLFRTRGSGISSDIESTIVPQFLSMMDGVEELNNVIVIGASNRQDLIDPAILRPGRFDIKIKVDRPDEFSAKEILGIYITPDLPWGKDSNGVSYVGQKEHSVIDRLRENKSYVVDLSTPELVVKHMISIVADYLYYDGAPLSWEDRRGNSHEYNTECIEVTFADGERKKLYVKDILVSGAMIESIVNRVKKMAIKRTITAGDDGIKKVDFYTAIRDEIKESSDLPNTNNPDDWAKIIGQRSESGQRIVNVRPIIGTKRAVNTRLTERVTTGQYL